MDEHRILVDQMGKNYMADFAWSTGERLGRILIQFKGGIGAAFTHA